LLPEFGQENVVATLDEALARAEQVLAALR
jgi:hypothetical protein